MVSIARDSTRIHVRAIHPRVGRLSHKTTTKRPLSCALLALPRVHNVHRACTRGHAHARPTRQAPSERPCGVISTRVELPPEAASAPSGRQPCSMGEAVWPHDAESTAPHGVVTEKPELTALPFGSTPAGAWAAHGSGQSTHIERRVWPSPARRGLCNQLPTLARSKCCLLQTVPFAHTGTHLPARKSSATAS